jgi:hypothetical protein
MLDRPPSRRRERQRVWQRRYRARVRDGQMVAPAAIRLHACFADAR